MKTTLNEIRSYGPCEDRWKHLLQHLDPRPADDELFDLTRVLDANGMKDTLWLLGQMVEKQLLVRFACDCAERAVTRHWAPRYPEDRRPQEAIEAARRWAKNPTGGNRAKARKAAKAASAVFYTAAYADAIAAVYATRAACAAVYAAAYAIAFAATRAFAAKAPEEREWQTNHLRKML